MPESADPNLREAAEPVAPVSRIVSIAARRRELWIWLAPVLLAILLLLLVGRRGAWAPEGWAPRPGMLVFLLCAALAGALHRPVGGASLALGAMIVYPGLLRVGVVPVAWVVAAALIGAELLQRAIEARRDLPLPERRSLSRLAGWVAIAILSVLAAGGWLVLLPDRFALALILGGTSWILIPVAYELVIRRSTRRESPLDLLRAQTPLLFDLAGLALGALTIVLADRGGWEIAWVVLAAFALLAAEAARNGLAAAGGVRRLDEAHRLRRAGVALAGGGAGILAVAEQVRAECVALLPFSWFQLELEVPDQGRASWWAEAEGALHPGEPSPPPVPPALPGIHRRGTWQLAERPLGGSRPIGRVRLWFDPRRIEPRTLELFDGLLPQMAASLREALVERFAQVDRLTGAASRRVLEQRLEEAFARSREEGTSLALLICDLDHFKRINDTYGHPTGDLALKTVAQVLLAPARGDDLCARFGGEEFVLLFEETTGETALEIAERLRKRVEALIVKAPSGERLALTMSVGVAAIPELTLRNAADLLHLADQALYAAKHLGRNLCLLDTGQGRLRTAAGEVVELLSGDQGPKENSAPVFFA
ncbi:MAG: GGDEF domain-containing protein [Thermoanaerobaculia bacterium]